MGKPIINPKTGQRIIIDKSQLKKSTDTSTKFRSDNRNIFERTQDKLYSFYQKKKPQLFKDFPITDLPNIPISWLTGHTSPEEGLGMVTPSASFNKEAATKIFNNLLKSKKLNSKQLYRFISKEPERLLNKDELSLLKEELKNKGILEMQKTPNLPYKKVLKEAIFPHGYDTQPKIQAVKDYILNPKNPNYNPEMLITQYMDDFMKIKYSTPRMREFVRRDNTLSSSPNRTTTWEYYLGYPQTNNPLYNVSKLSTNKKPVYTLNSDVTKNRLKNRGEENNLIEMFEDYLGSRDNFTPWYIKDSFEINKFPAKTSGFKDATIGHDNFFGTMGGYSLEHKPLPGGRHEFLMSDVWDLHPLQNVYNFPSFMRNKNTGLLKSVFKPLQKIEAGKTLGIGKPLNVKSGFIYNPKLGKITKTYRDGGELDKLSKISNKQYRHSENYKKYDQLKTNADLRQWGIDYYNDPSILRKLYNNITFPEVLPFDEEMAKNAASNIQNNLRTVKEILSSPFPSMRGNSAFYTPRNHEIYYDTSLSREEKKDLFPHEALGHASGAFPMNLKRMESILEGNLANPEDVPSDIKNDFKYYSDPKELYAAIKRAQYKIINEKGYKFNHTFTDEDIQQYLDREDMFDDYFRTIKEDKRNEVVKNLLNEIVYNSPQQETNIPFQAKKGGFLPIYQGGGNIKKFRLGGETDDTTKQDTIPYVSMKKLPPGIMPILTKIAGARFEQVDSIANFYNEFVKYKNQRIKSNTDNLPPEKIKMSPEELDWRTRAANARRAQFPLSFNDFMSFVRNTYKGREGRTFADPKLEKELKEGIRGVSRKNFVNKYYGIPYDKEMIVPSKYTPSIKDKNSNPNFEFGDKYRSQFVEELKRELPSTWYSRPKLDVSRLSSTKGDLLQNLGTFKVQRGEDEKGKYTAVMDPWDLSLNNPIYNNLTKLMGISYDDLNFPFDFYTRVYDDEINKKQNGGYINKFRDGGETNTLSPDKKRKLLIFSETGKNFSPTYQFPFQTLLINNPYLPPEYYLTGDEENYPTPLRKFLEDYKQKFTEWYNTEGKKKLQEELEREKNYSLEYEKLYEEWQERKRIHEETNYTDDYKNFVLKALPPHTLDYLNKIDSIDSVFSKKYPILNMGLQEFIDNPARAGLSNSTSLSPDADAFSKFQDLKQKAYEEYNKEIEEKMLPISREYFSRTPEISEINNIISNAALDLPTSEYQIREIAERPFKQQIDNVDDKILINLHEYLKDPYNRTIAPFLEPEPQRDYFPNLPQFNPENDYINNFIFHPANPQRKEDKPYDMFVKDSKKLGEWYKKNKGYDYSVIPIYGDSTLVKDNLAKIDSLDDIAIYGHSNDKIMGGLKNKDWNRWISEKNPRNCILGTCTGEKVVKTLPNVKNIWGTKGISFFGTNPYFKTLQDVLIQNTDQAGVFRTPKKGENWDIYNPRKQNGGLINYATGGVVKDNAGYWNKNNWGKPVEIASNNITMKGVNQPLLGISDIGDVQYMSPGNDYKFEGSRVTEIPFAQWGQIKSNVQMKNQEHNREEYGQGGKLKNTTIPSKSERFLRQSWAESSWDLKAKSPKGALGPLQIMPNLYKDYVKATGDKTPYSKVTELPHATKVRNWALDDLANSTFIKDKKQTEAVRLAKQYAAYNWGRGNLVNFLNNLKSQGVDIYNSTEWTKKLPKEPKDYLDKILFMGNEEFEKEFKKAKTSHPNRKYFIDPVHKYGGNLMKRYNAGGPIASEASINNASGMAAAFSGLNSLAQPLLGQDEYGGKTLGSHLLSGVGAGAAAGAALGPWGMAAGALIGGAAGFFGNKREDRLANEALQGQRAGYTSAYANGGKLNIFNSNFYPKTDYLGGAWNSRNMLFSQDNKNFLNMYAMGGNMPTMSRELARGKEVEKEHEPTLNFIKSFYKKKNRFPSLKQVATSIATDHIKDWAKATSKEHPREYSYYKMLVDGKMSDEVSKYAFGGHTHPADVGLGDLESFRNSMLKADGGQMLTTYDSGGSHDENPYGGIPLGEDALVEQGETRFEDYIFSDRLKAVNALKYGLPKKFTNMTFAKASKNLAKEGSERPYDLISKRGQEMMTKRLVGASEEIRKQKEEEEQMNSLRNNIFQDGGLLDWVMQRDSWEQGNSNLPYNFDNRVQNSLQPISLMSSLPSTPNTIRSLRTPNLLAGSTPSNVLPSNTKPLPTPLVKSGIPNSVSNSSPKLMNSSNPIARGDYSNNNLKTGSDWLRYAPVAYNFLAAASLKKPKNISLPRISGDLSRLGYTPKYMDETRGLGSINTAYRGSLASLNDISGGNAAANRASILGSIPGYLKGREQLYSSINAANTDQWTKAQQMRSELGLRGAMSDQQMAAYEEDINAKNLAGYQNNLYGLLGAGAEGLGGIGSENYWGKIAPRIYGYNQRGQFTGKWGGRIRNIKKRK